MGTLTDLINTLTKLVNTTTPILVALAFLFFLWGLASWILNMADTEKHEAGKQRMIWGLVALFFIMYIAGLLSVLQNTFFGSGSNTSSSIIQNEKILNNGTSRGTLSNDSTDGNQGSNVRTGESGTRFVAEPRTSGGGSSGGGTSGSFLSGVRDLFLR